MEKFPVTPETAGVILPLYIDGFRCGFVPSRFVAPICEISDSFFNGVSISIHHSDLNQIASKLSLNTKTEEIDLFTVEKDKTGLVVQRSLARRLGLFTRVIHLIIVSPSAFLLGKRAQNKVAAGYWDSAVGGMVKAHETLEVALIRETKEEVGLTITQNQITKLGSKIFSEEIPEGFLFEEVTFFKLCVKKEFIPALTKEVDSWLWIDKSNNSFMIKNKVTPQAKFGIKLLKS